MFKALDQMLGYRKKSFENAHALLDTLRGDPSDLKALKVFQQLLAREIARAERKIRELKGHLTAIRQTGGASAAKRTSYLMNRVERVRQVGYIWRCFGDAIAFSYMDKFALKQCFYQTERPKPKQDAGFIIDKSGFGYEIQLLEAAVAKGIPAILTDLTTTIRHGDVCLMGATDPYLIEVKASKGLDRRGRRQREGLAKLHQFFETDKAEDLRGFSNIHRIAFDVPEKTYVDAINSTIANAVTAGYAHCSPEPGLFYLVLNSDGPDAGEAIRSLDLRSAPWVFKLNAVKNQRGWAPYFPFTLSIRDKDHLWSFIRGDIYILVLVEIDRFNQIAKANGHSAEFIREDQDCALEIAVPGADAPGRVSSHMLARIGLEFVSPEWIVLSAINAFARGMEIAKKEQSDVHI